MFEDDSSGFNLDRISAASVKKILLQQIIFTGAKHQDDGEMLRTKYKALNSNYKPGKMKLSHSNKRPVDDLPVPQVILFREEKLDLFWKDIRRIGPGLANRGNTCFLNSVLQVLTHTPPLVNYILSGLHQKSCKYIFITTKTCVSRSFLVKKDIYIRSNNRAQDLRSVGRTTVQL